MRVLKIKDNTFRHTSLIILLGLIVVWIFLLPVMCNLDQFFEFKDNSNQNFETSFTEGTGGFNLNLYISQLTEDRFYIKLTYNAYASENVSSLGFYEIQLQFAIEPDRHEIYPVIKTYYYNLEDNPIHITKGVRLSVGDDLIIEGSSKISFNNKGIILNKTITYEINYTMPVSGKAIEYDLFIANVWGLVLYIVSLLVILLGIWKILSVPDPKTQALQEKKRQERDFVTYLKKNKEEENT